MKPFVYLDSAKLWDISMQFTRFFSQTGMEPPLPRYYKNLIWGSVLDGSFQPKG